MDGVRVEVEVALEMNFDRSRVTVDRARRVVRRPRLLRLLDESPSRIITLIGPAGYGKTTLAHQWLEDHGRTATWYGATAAAADVAATASGLASAASAVVDGAGSAMRSRLRVSQSPADEAVVLAEVLAADLQQWPREAWLVVDDYQFVSDVPAAEAFVETLVFGAPINMLLASRKRPSWATSRRLLYGEAYELGRNLLAMDSDEAAAVISDGVGTPFPGLLALAEGWPAVIGLAAHIRIGRLPESQLPEQLFDFFAEELYRALSPASKVGLSRMAAVSRADPAVAHTLLGVDANRILGECWEAGLVVRRPGDIYEIHPLIRNFLDRAKERDAQSPTDAFEALVDLFVERGSWDDALEVARRSSEQGTIERVIARTLDPLMNEGRLQTLTDVVNDVRARSIATPMLDLVEAEVAFRRACYRQSEVLASRAGEHLRADHPARSRALFRAGHAAFFADRTREALTYASASREAALNSADLTNALWLQFVAMTELELPGSHDVLEQLAAAASDDPHDVVRVATGRLIVADRWGRVHDALAAAEAAYWLVSRVPDPMIRTSFYNMFGRVLTDAGEYARALEVAQQGIDEIENARLEFALPHMLMPKSSAQLGQGHVTSALNTAEQAIRFASDAHAAANCALLRARALLVAREFNSARSCLATHASTQLDPATRGEILAHDALAAACLGDAATARARAEDARHASSTVQTETVALVATVLACDSQRERSRSARAILTAVAHTEHVDYVVLAARASDEARRLLNTGTATHGPAVERARRLVEQPVTIVRAENDLTVREAEVLELVSRGMSNREIARDLFISEVTVKVHVRHILAKLRVRSRTEAAVIHMKKQARA